MGHLIILISFTRREVESDGGAMCADVMDLCYNETSVIEDIGITDATL